MGQRRDLWFRLTVAVVLLTVAFSFAIHEWHGFIFNEEGTFGRNESREGLRHPQEGHHHDHEEEEGHNHHSDTDQHVHQHPESLYHHSVVITDSVNCSRAGIDTLEDGGNVVDAGIASLLCLGVVHPHSAGVGGIFSGILYNQSTGISKSINFLFNGTESSSHGIPATLQGIRHLHSLFGSLTWEKLFVSAIRLARDGFHVDKSLALALNSSKEKICHSDMRDLFCDKNGSVKALGSVVTNQKLSELLQSVSANDLHLLDGLGMKLAQDLPLGERQDFAMNFQRCQEEVTDPLSINEEEYTALTSASPLSGTIISEALKMAREQNTSFLNNEGFYNSTSHYMNLLNTARQLYSEATERQSQHSNAEASHIGVLDHSGNILFISTSLNSSFGSMRFLPSTGVILSDFYFRPTASLPPWSCPLIIKVKSNENDDNEEEEEVLAVGTTGGPSAPFIAAQIIVNRILLGMSAQEAVTSPLLHLEMGRPDTLPSACISMVTDGSDTYTVLMEMENRLEAALGCNDKSLAFIMQRHAGHVGAYGAPASRAHAIGY